MDESMKQAFTTATTTIKSDVLEMMAVALPAGLAIMGIQMAVRIGLNFFRSVAG